MDLRERRSDEFARHPWEVVRARIVTSLLERHLGQGDAAGGVILDLGCGDLYIASKIAALFPQRTVVAVDTAFDASFLARARHEGLPPNLVALPKLDFDTPETPDRIDVVLLLDVLEHIRDDRVFLESLYKSGRVHEGTLFIVTVPAFQQLFSAHDEMLGHHRRYRLEELRALTTAKQDIEAGYFFGIPLLVRLLQVVAERLHRSAPREAKGVGQWKGYGKLDSLLETVLWLDFRLYRSLDKLDLKLPGLSCYQVFRPALPDPS